MALLFFDGFDHYGASGDPVALGKWGSSSSATFTAQTTLPRTGAYSLRCNQGAATITSKTFTTSGGAVVGVAIQIPVGSSFAAVDLIQVLESAIVHVAVGVTTGGLLTIKRGSTVLATGTKVLTVGNWYYIELKTIIGATGSYELRIDGVVELINGSVNTQNGGTGVWNKILMTMIATAGGTTYWDDFYLCDTSGAAPTNTFLGPVKVDTIMPQTDAVSAGSNAGLTCSTGTDHGALVDEIPPNTTDFNSSPTVGVKDTYQYPNMNLTGTILGIQTCMYVNKADATARTICAVVRAGGTDYDGVAISPTTTFQYQTEVRALNPNTGVAWTASDITALQAGMKVVS